ncbi:MAG: GTP-binding protein, partial [Nodosilinea sp.]
MPAADYSPHLPSPDATTWEEVEAELGELVATAAGTPLALPAADAATWEAVEQELTDLVIDFQDL